MVNKKGDFESMIYVVILIFIIGFIFIFVNRLNHQFSITTESIFNSSDQLKNSSAIPALQKIRNTEDNAWDYGFLAIYIGCILSLGVSAYSTRIHPIFYIIYGVLGLFVLVVGVMLSNAWQSAAENPEMTETITRFPITNFLLGSYAPLAITFMLVVFMVLLFGKTPDSEKEAFN